MLNSGVSRPTSSGLRAKASGQRRCRDPVGCGKVTTVEQHRAITVTVTIVTIESVENIVTIVTIVTTVETGITSASAESAAAEFSSRFATSLSFVCRRRKTTRAASC